MEELVKKLEKVLDQKLEIEYGDEITVRSSDSNPPEMKDINAVFDSESDFIQWANFIIQISKNES